MVAAPTRTHNTPVDSPQGSIEGMGMMLILQQQPPASSSSSFYLGGACPLGSRSPGSGHAPSFGGSPSRAVVEAPAGKGRSGGSCCNHVKEQQFWDATVAEYGPRPDMGLRLPLEVGHSLGCCMSSGGSGFSGTMGREDSGAQQIRMLLDDDDLLPHGFGDFEVGSGPLKRGFSDTIYDFDAPLSSPPSFATAQATPQGEDITFEGLVARGTLVGLGRTCPLAKEETFSSLELSEESDENKVFDRGEPAPGTSMSS